MSLQDLPQGIETASSSTSVGVDDRRRLNRLDRVSPYLISLLRGSASADTPAMLFDDVDAPPLGEDLAPARGFAIGLMLAIPAWAIIGTLIWAVLH